MLFCGRVQCMLCVQPTDLWLHSKHICDSIHELCFGIGMPCGMEFEWSQVVCGVDHLHLLSLVATCLAYIMYVLP